MSEYKYLTLAGARTALASRLCDPNMVKWTTDELTLYISEALRIWNCLTLTWRQEFVFSPTDNWNSLGSIPLSPRLRTITDEDCYRLMEYNLSEPPSGSVWTGTSQFSIADLAGALQRRRDEIIQVANCNNTILTLPSTPNTRRVLLPDATLETQRVRFGSLGGNVVLGFGDGGFGEGGFGGDTQTFVYTTLSRDDQLSEEFFEPDFPFIVPSSPQAWMVASEPPLALDVDIAPSIPGEYEALVLQSGIALTPPTPRLLGIPDDFAWIARWGALADLLGRESDATDRLRASYCQKRHSDGLKLIAEYPWLLLANVNGVPVDIPGFAEMDTYSPEWDSSEIWPAVVVGGMDFFWAPVGGSVGVTVVGNAPCPILDSDFIQVSRANWDAVLSMAQFLAVFKLGGAEFQSALPLEAYFLKAAEAESGRLGKLGMFSDVLTSRASEEVRVQERW